MMNFLNKITKHILQNFDTTNSIFVFPNSLSVKFFKLIVAQNQPITILNTSTLDHLLLKEAKLRTESDLFFIALIYKYFLKHCPKQTVFEDFSQFYQLGQAILNDFKDIDKNLINPEQIFINLAELEKIDKKHEYLTEKQLEVIKTYWKKHQKAFDTDLYANLFSKLKDIYNDFTNYILKHKIAHKGLINRIIAQKLQQNPNSAFQEYQNYVFIGFHYLSKSEFKIFNILKKQGKAHFYWDWDKYYVYEEPAHEAGKFMQQNLKNFPDLSPENLHNNLNSKKNLYIISVPKNSIQTKTINYILQNHNINPNKTAIILLDINFFYPVIYSLNFDNLFISTELPLYTSPIFSFFQKWLYILQRLIQVKNIHYKDFISFINTDIYQKFDPNTHLTTNQIINKRIEYITPKFIEQNTAPQAKLFFQILNLTSKSPTELINKIFQILETTIKNIIATKTKDNQNPIEQEFLYKIFLLIRNMKNFFTSEEYQDFQKIIISPNYTPEQIKSLIITLLRSTLYEQGIELESKEFNGLKLLSINKTRNLDFENIIFLGLNEGVYPNLNRIPSLLTEFIRSVYSLPTLKDQEIIAAYLFYRLLHFAQNIYLIYSNVQDKKIEGKSRYIFQLEYEFKNKWNIQNLEYKEDFYLIPYPTPQLPPIENIHKFIDKISAHHLIDYITCKRKFYLKHIQKITPPTSDDISLERAEIGSFIHKVLEKLYLKIIQTKQNHTIELSDLENIIKNPKTISEIIEQVNKEESFTEHFQVNFNLGLNIIIKDVIEHYVLKVINYDKQLTPFQIIKLEKQSADDEHGSFILNYNDFKLKAIIDRIHKKDNKIYIVDYKTAKKDPLKLPKNYDFFSYLEEDFNSSQQYVFQLLFYQFIYYKKTNQIAIPLLYSIPNLNNPKYTPLINDIDSPQQWEIILNEYFQPFLNHLLNDIEISYLAPFDYTPENLDTCRYCDYKKFCLKFI